MALTIQNINDYLTSLDVKDTLQGTSFHLDTTNELGFDPKNLFDFFTATPYGQWTNKLPPNPNVVAEAIQRALDAVNTTPPTVGSDGQKYVRWLLECYTYDRRRSCSLIKVDRMLTFTGLH